MISELMFVSNRSFRVFALGYPIIFGSVIWNTHTPILRDDGSIKKIYGNGCQFIELMNVRVLNQSIERKYLRRF